MNPDAAIAFYAKEFPSTSRTTWAGMAALKSPNNVLVLFTKVDQPPATQPQTAFAFQYTSPASATMMRRARRRRDAAAALPETVTARRINSEYLEQGGVWPDEDPARGRVDKQRQTGWRRRRCRARGPDDALIEVQGDRPAELQPTCTWPREPFCSRWVSEAPERPDSAGCRGITPPSHRPANCRCLPGGTWRKSADVDGMVALGNPADWRRIMGGYTRPISHSPAWRPSRRSRAQRRGSDAIKLRAENVTFLEQTRPAIRARSSRAQPRSARLAEVK